MVSKLKAFLFVAALLLTPALSYAAIATPWSATSTDPGFISPNLINGNNPWLKITSTGTSTFSNGINLLGGCFSINGNCITGSGGGTPGGASSTVQYNANGVFAGNNGLTYTGTNLGIGTTSPKELLNLSQSTGYTTVRVDSGTHSGYFSTNDQFPGTYIGSNSNDLLGFVVNNTPVGGWNTSGNLYIGNTNKVTMSANTFGGYLYVQGDGTGDNGEDTILVIQAPKAQPQEADLSLARTDPLNGANREFSDVDDECYGTPTLLNTNCYDHFASWVVAKAGTGQLRPWGVRFWNQDAGSVAVVGKWGLIVDPSGATAVGQYASTTGAATNKYDPTITLQAGSTTTASPIFQVDNTLGTKYFQVRTTGASTSALTISSLADGCLNVASGLVGSTGSACGGGSGTNYLTNSGANTFLNTGSNLRAPTIDATSTGFLLNGANFAYSSTTNGATFLGLGAGGGAPTTSATVTGNTSIGLQAGAFQDSTGINNTYLGYRAGFNATTSDRNTGVGYGALLGNASFTNGGDNTAVGYFALSNIRAGINNTAVGVNSLLTNQTGNNNTAVGLLALSVNTTGSQNTAMGQSALLNTTGDDNVGIGYSSMLGNTSGTKNISIGREALNFNQTGTDNVAIGYRAGFGVSANSNSRNVFIGEFAANAITTGSGNVFAGFQAGKSLTTGAANVVLGQNVDLPDPTANGQLNIGNVLYGTGLYNNSSTLSSAATGGKIGIGTTSPYSTLSVAGQVVASNYVATSTSALSTYAGGVTSIVTSGANVPGTFVSNTAGYAANTAAGLSVLDGGFALTSPLVVFHTINGTDTGTTTQIVNEGTGPSFEVDDSANDATPFVIDASGNTGIGTSTPWRNFSTTGTVALSGLTTSSAAQATTLCRSASFDIVADSLVCGSSARRYKYEITGISDKHALDDILALAPSTYYFKPDFNGELQSDPNYSRLQVGLIADDAIEVNPAFGKVETATTTFEGKTYAPGASAGVDYDAVVASLVGAVKAQQKEIGTVVATGQRYWNWGLLALFLLYAGYNEWDKRRRK